jgi:hypothetical protein
MDNFENEGPELFEKMQKEKLRRSQEIKDKVKKTYKNRYFMLTNNK